MDLSGKYQLWLSSVDRNGKQIHPDVLAAAKEIGNNFFAYRHGEIQCESLANSIVQNTVEWTSRRHKRKAIANSREDHLHRYLTTAYRRNVDKFLLRQSRIMPVGSERLERSAQHRRHCREVDNITGRILFREIIEMMKPEARSVFSYRLAGYDMSDIAVHLGAKSRRYMAQRYFRGLQAAVDMGMPGLDLHLSAHGRFKRQEPGTAICG
jgi:hypothetical protein